jgi:hypothetical protein
LPRIQDMVQAVGYFGSAGAAVMWIPQAVRAVRLRRQTSALAGISPAAYVMAMAFGLLTNAGPVVLAGCVNLACATVITSVLLRSRGTAE